MTARTAAPAAAKGRTAREGRGYATEIVATGYAYPGEVVDNDLFFSRCQFPITTDREALERETLMKTRFWCAEGENTWTLARTAVAMALADEPSLRDEIDVVVVASGTTMPVFHAPEKDNAGVADLAPLVLRELGRTDALGLDIKACYCTGFLRGVQVADGLLANTDYRAALVIATEQGSRFAVAPTNRSSFCFIMSDAAGAAILRKRPSESGIGLLDYIGHTDVDKFSWVGIGPDAASTIMRGSRAGEATHAMLVDTAKRLLERNGLVIDDVDWVLPIQTHAGVIEGMRAAIGCPAEKLLWAGDVTGFSGSASIPAALAERVRDGTIKKGDLVLSLAVGAGMNCAGALYYY